MTDESEGQGELVGPPWSVDVLADLHAGVFDEQTAAGLWPRVNGDPAARAIIEALESTTADLSELAQDIPPMPADVAARIDAALEQQRQAWTGNGHGVLPGGHPNGNVGGGGNVGGVGGDPDAAARQAAGGDVVRLDAARRKRNRRLGWTTGLLTVAAAAVAVVMVAIPDGPGDPRSRVAAPPPPAQSQASDDGPLAVDRGNPAAAVSGISGIRDFGPLGNEERLDSCLAANGVDPAVPPVGFRPVTIDGEQAVMVLLTTGELGRLRLLALAPDCGPDNPGVVLDETVGHHG